MMEESIPMNGGDGPNSYTQNSQIQEEAIDRAKLLLINSIQQKLTIHENSKATQVFTIADLGCSVGPNTFVCIKTMIEAVQNTFKKSHHYLLDSKMPEFQVFFNDHLANDFNTLFKSLPSDRNYMASGVPGSFHGRLFPKASINLMHSSSALHWLTKVPEQVTKKDSPAWNKGRITYADSSREVVEAYTAQFKEDMEGFFSARSVEMAKDGLLAIHMPCRQDGTLPFESIAMQRIEYCLGHALVDMAKEGIVSEALVDSFNVPIFVPNVSEIKQVVSSISNLSIEKMEVLCIKMNMKTHDDARTSSRHLRAVMEGMICKHFGTDKLMDDLFERYAQKLLEFFNNMPQLSNIYKLELMFVLVKCNDI